MTSTAHILSLAMHTALYVAFISYILAYTNHVFSRVFAETERRIRANDPDYNTAFLYAVSSLNSSKSPVRYIATAAAAVAD